MKWNQDLQINIKSWVVMSNDVSCCHRHIYSDRYLHMGKKQSEQSRNARDASGET